MLSSVLTPTVLLTWTLSTSNVVKRESNLSSRSPKLEDHSHLTTFLDSKHLLALLTEQLGHAQIEDAILNCGSAHAQYEI